MKTPDKHTASCCAPTPIANAKAAPKQIDKTVGQTNKPIATHLHAVAGTAASKPEASS